jgi:hypothetical protein
MSKPQAFTEKLDAASLDFFCNIAREPFSKQAVHFLNAYWNEVGNQAPFIFSVAFECMKYADMHTKGISLIHLYDEGNDLDFNIGLYFYEKLCVRVLEAPEGKIWREDPTFAPSMPTMMTAIVRKQELREKVDVNFDGRISFLEYLLYQYQEYCNPADFCERSMRVYNENEHPEITKARIALEEVNVAIRAYEKEKVKLQEEAQLPGVRGLTAKHTFAQLSASPLAEKLSTLLIKAEFAVRRATKLFGDGSTYLADEAAAASFKPTQGTMFWMNADLNLKKQLYGRRAIATHSIVGSKTKTAPKRPVCIKSRHSAEVEVS